MPMTGQIFMGRYQTVRLLGEGGMGRVFLANDQTARRQVVVKVLHDHIANQPRVRESFQQEMLFMAQFKHPHAVELIDSAFDGPDGPCIVMEYIQGVTLDELLHRHRRLSVVRTGRLLGQLCLALQAAHSIGLIHRDLKPGNLMVERPDTPPEKLKVMDLGLAKLSSALYIPLERLSHPEDYFSACGTPDYMCPEQIRGDELDHRSDLYSVGVILFELLTGQVPFPRDDLQEVMLAHEQCKPPTFAKVGLGDAVAPQVEAVVQSCLSKYPNERPATALDLLGRYEKAVGMKMLRPDQYAQAQNPLATTPLPAAAQRLEPHAEVYKMEAWMPERIAVVKLKGFVDDFHGEVMESVPGMICVRLPFRGAGASKQGLLTRLGLVKAKLDHVNVRMLMEKRAIDQQSRLHVTLILAPSGGLLQTQDPNWFPYCDDVYRTLRAYFIGHDGQ